MSLDKNIGFYEFLNTGVITTYPPALTDTKESIVSAKTGSPSTFTILIKS